MGVSAYTPIKSDVIDEKLAEYVNKHIARQKLKVLTSRESEGVYFFGSKKLMMKVDNRQL